MPLSAELRAAGVNPDDKPAVVAYIAALPIPRDRREGYLRLFYGETNQTPPLHEIEAVRAKGSP